MVDLLTSAQMRAIEQAAISAGEVTGLALMERAGRGVVGAMLAQWPDLARNAQHAVVLCGPGNNGGDGFVVARRLRDKGWTVEVFLWGDPEGMPPDARRNHDIWCAMGDVRPLSVEAVARGPRPAVLIDALFGTGCSRAIPLECANAFHAVENREVGDTHPWLVPFHRVAVDCPSGLDMDSGQWLLPERPETAEDDFDAQLRWWTEQAARRLLHADLVVTFHRAKLGHYLNAPLIGALRTVDIGLGKEDRHPAHLAMPRSEDRACLIDFDPPRGQSGRIWPWHDLDKGRSGGAGHKFDHGHALILSGGSGRTGAARLAARGALRVGAGLVTLGVPGSAQLEVSGQVTAIMLARAGTPEELTAALQDGRINAVCLGPGLGLARAPALVLAALGEGGSTTHPTRSVVLDADALSCFGDDPSTLFERVHDKCVLTPHGGEFARLFPDIAERLSKPATTGPAFSKVDATRAAAARAGCTVLFKGADTVIAAPDGRCSVNASVYARAAPWLATAGSGDVLAGFITGLLARGHAPMQAAETAAWLHTECARAFGPGLIAEDLPEILPQVLRDLS